MHEEKCHRNAERCYPIAYNSNRCCFLQSNAIIETFRIENCEKQFSFARLPP